MAAATNRDKFERRWFKNLTVSPFVVAGADLRRTHPRRICNLDGGDVAAIRHDPTAIRHLFESGEYPYKNSMREGLYESHMLELQRELLKAQRWIEAAGQRVVILAGRPRRRCKQGGTIKRFTEHMNPRNRAWSRCISDRARAHAIALAIALLPAAGEQADRLATALGSNG